MKIIITDTSLQTGGCSRHGPIPGDLGGTDSAPRCCLAKQMGYDRCILPRGKMTGEVDIPCGSLPADGDTGVHLSLCCGGRSLKVGKCLPPTAKTEVPTTGYFCCSRNAWEMQVVPGDRAGVMLHITILLCALLPYLSGSTKSCTFPSASR